MVPPRGGFNQSRPPRAPKLDRDQVCPFLVRVFVNFGSNHSTSEFGIERVPKHDEYELYTWRDATVKEVILSLRDIAPSLRGNHLTRYSVRLVYYDTQKEAYTHSELGHASVSELLAKDGGARNRSLAKTLADAKFVIGDYLDVAFIPGGPQAQGPGLSGPPPPGVGPTFNPRDAPPHAGPPGRGHPGSAPGPPARGGWGAPRGDRRDGPPGRAPSPPRGAGWGPAPGPGPVRGVGGWGAPQRGGVASGRGGGPGRGAADHGWGARRPSAGGSGPGHGREEYVRDLRERHRDSRSLSPVRGPARERERERSRSPPPGKDAPPHRANGGDIEMS